MCFVTWNAWATLPGNVSGPERRCLVTDHFFILLLTNGLALSLVVATLGDKLDTTAAHDAGSEHVAVELLLRRELQDVEGVLGVLQLLVVVDRLDLDLALRDVDVVEGIRGDGAPEKVMLLSIKRVLF